MCKDVYIKANVYYEWLNLFICWYCENMLVPFYTFKRRKKNTHQPAAMVWWVKEGCNAIKKTTQLRLRLLGGTSLKMTLYKSAQLWNVFITSKGII